MVNLSSNIKESYEREILDIFNLISHLALKEGINVFLVGGMVRDLLLDNPSVDLDITVENISGVEFAKRLAEHYGTEPKIYPQFRTATVFTKEELKIDIATCRKEVYSEPGVLPEVERGNIKEDLSRRDFTVNAMAISLNKKNFGEVLDFYGGIKDLKSKLLRVLHKDSFIDDPTRIIRLIRFASRLGFNIEQSTRKCLNEAIEENRLENVSKDRIWNEMKSILEEKNLCSQIQLFDEYIGLNLIHPSLELEKVPASLFQEAKKNFEDLKENVLIEKDDSLNPKFWIMNFLILTERLEKSEVKTICEKYNFSNKEKKKILDYKDNKQKTKNFLKQADKLKPSEVFSYLKPLPIESIFIIISECKKIDIKRKICYFLTESQFVSLEINGEDLKKLGVSPGPKMKKLLRKVLKAKIDGEVQDKDSELRYIKNML